MEFLLEIIMFLAKTATIVLAVLLIVAGIAVILAKGRQSGGLIVTSLNDHFRQLRQQIQQNILTKSQWRQQQREDKRQQKQREQQSTGKNVYVIDFNGDLRASSVQNLRQEVTAVLTVAHENDEAVIRLESAGGMVHAYGLAASQLNRLRAHGLSVTITVDKVAASGGYMMACVGNYILASPFAVIGSVGVIAQLPNFNRWLKENHIDFEQITAGEYKRTLSMFGENTDEGRQKFKQEIEETHQLFKNYVAEKRPQVNIDDIATGEHWHAQDAKNKALVDEINTSDDYLLRLSHDCNIYHISYKLPKSALERLKQPMQKLWGHINDYFYAKRL